MIKIRGKFEHGLVTAAAAGRERRSGVARTEQIASVRRKFISAVQTTLLLTVGNMWSQVQMVGTSIIFR